MRITNEGRGCDPTTEIKPESSSSTREVKAEQEESKGKEDNSTPVKQEEHSPDLDSEDALTPEGVVAAVQRLLATRESEASVNVQPDDGRETAQSPAASGERTSALIATGELRYGPYASQEQDMLEGETEHQIRSCLVLLSS